VVVDGAQPTVDLEVCDAGVQDDHDGSSAVVCAVVEPPDWPDRAAVLAGKIAGF
jgi:hypothetical protein